jgi:hypothetical protein
MRRPTTSVKHNPIRFAGEAPVLPKTILQPGCSAGLFVAPLLGGLFDESNHSGIAGALEGSFGQAG